ncbi:MAG TPA: glycoside hydrolase family 2 TIM barrel-domain containing protein [bacterium]|nr:glycoside hydrolase family 2 TIM barrel-domain containing protein [bacterium]
MILDGKWKATSVITSELDFIKPGFDDSGWTDIEVPSHWQTAPGFEDYPEKLLYRHHFEFDKPVPEKRYFLKFNGVFYFCRVWFNGEYLGEHTGYFDPFEFEVTKNLKEGKNTVSVFVRCEIERDLNEKRQVLGVFGNWDCKPDSIQPGGIWNSVELTERGQSFIKKLDIGDFELNGGAALAMARTKIVIEKLRRKNDLKLLWNVTPDNFTGRDYGGELLLPAPDSEIKEIAFELNMPEARLWWTWDHGEQNLYRLTLKLFNGDEQLDAADVRFGIRTIEMKNWIFKLNGKRIFCRGSNYAPCNIRISDVTRQDYERDVELALGANLNMLRIHAHVERKSFYDVCDERGILIWQDFPLQWYYSRDILNPAIDQIKEMPAMLMSHPSIVIWCCHNEPFKIPPGLSPQEIIKSGNIRDFVASMSSMLGPNFNKDTLDRRLETALLSVDRSRPVVRSSGLMGLVGEGSDSHLYFGWYFGKMRMIKALRGLNRKAFRFITEYGSQAYPSMESFREMSDAERIEDVDWELLEEKNKLQKDFMDRFVPVGEGMTLEEYIEFSQWYQAKLIKFHNELFRQIKYRPCGGAVHFMLTDCCPAVTWSVVDNNRVPKKGYEALKESFSPLHVMADFPRSWYPCGDSISLRLYAVNDTYRKYEAVSLHWTIFNSDGDCMAEDMRVFDMPEDSLVKIEKMCWDTGEAVPGGYALVLEIKSEDIRSITNQYEFELRR